MTKTMILPQNKIALVDDEDYERVMQYKWHVNKAKNTYYVLRNLSINEGSGTISLHRLIMNPKPNEEIDHINGDGWDCRKCNLRTATRSTNMMNQQKWRKLSSKYKGVCWYKKYGCWNCSIGINRKIKNLGYFKIEEDAARAYDTAAKKLFGEYARLNFPEEN